MRVLPHLFDQNKEWSQRIRAKDPQFFTHLSHLQQPQYLWIGCSDSRVPANEIVGLLPGELFVHRNVANVVVHTDLNCLSVIQYAVEALNVKHIIVCGHLGCGGVKAAYDNKRLGLIDNWLRHIQDVAFKHKDVLNVLPSEDKKLNTLCALNVVEQAMNVCQTTVVQQAWDRGQPLCVHAWEYDLKDGLLRDLDFCVKNSDEMMASYAQAIKRAQNVL